MLEIILLKYLIILDLLVIFLCILRLMIRKILTLSRIIYIIILLGLLFVFFSRLAGDHFFSLLCYWGIKSMNCKDYLPDWNIRNGIDDAGLIILGGAIVAFILLIKNQNIKDLIISEFNLLGTNVSLLSKKIKKLEENFISIDIDNQSTEIYEKIVRKAKNPDEILELLALEMDKIIKTVHRSKTGITNEIHPSIVDLIELLRKKGLLESNLAEAIKDFFNLKIINATKNKGKNTLALIELGKRLLKLLLNSLKKMFLNDNRPFGSINKISMTPVKIQESTSKNIVVYSKVNLVDSLANYFPLEKLTKQNFRIIEKWKENEKEAEVLKTELLLSDHIEVFLIIAIDCSGSMDKGEKMQKSKSAAIVFLEKLNFFPMLHFKIKILKISSTDSGFTSSNWYTIKEIGNIKEEIDKLKAHGGTPLWNTLTNAVLSMKGEPSTGYKMIICITDGDDTEDAGLYEKLLDTIENQNPQIVSIMFFENNDDRGKLIPKMSKLSQKSGAGPRGIGTFTDALPEDLNSVFERIVNSITKSYAIYWKSTALELGTQVNVTLQVGYKTDDDEMKSDIQRFTYILE